MYSLQNIPPLNQEIMKNIIMFIIVSLFIDMPQSVSISFAFRAYHGHVVSLIDISTYKLNNMTDGVHKKPDFVHIVSMS